MANRRNLGEFLSGALGLALTVGIALVIAVVLIILLSKQPGTTIYYFFAGPLTNKYYFGNMLNMALRTSKALILAR